MSGLDETRDRLAHFMARTDGTSIERPDLLLGQIALDRGLLTPAELVDCLEELEKKQTQFGQILLRRKIVNADGLAHLLQEQQRRSEALPGFPRYDVGEKIGEGGMGTVYRARDKELNRDVALKVIRPGAHSTTMKERFRREARAAAGLAHPNVITVYDAGEYEGRLFLIMELVVGTSFTTHLADTKDFRASVALLEQAARGVAAAHQKGIVHRDIKPDNILITTDGVPKVGDFGLARQVKTDVQLTQSGATMGTPHYMSPEQVTGRQDEMGLPTDVYGLGVILYEVLTGRVPHTGDNIVDITRRISNDDPTPPRRLRAAVPRDLESICLKALEKRPRDRYADAGAFADDLQRYLDGKPIVARPSTVIDRLWKQVRRRSGMYAAASIAAVATVIAGILFFSGDRTALRESERIRQISEAFLELNLRTLPSMKRLSDAWHGATPGADRVRMLEEIEAQTRGVSERYPASRLPDACRGLATFMAGREDEGLKQLDAACTRAGDDPFPHIFKARALFAIYVRGLTIPRTRFLTNGAFQKAPFVETGAMKELRESAMKAIETARSLESWNRIRQGEEYKVFAEAAALVAGRKFAQGAKRLADLAQDPILQDEAAELRGLALCFDDQEEPAAVAWESVGGGKWPWPLYFAGYSRRILARQASDRGENPESQLRRAIADLTECLSIRPVMHEAFQLRAELEFDFAIHEERPGGDPFPWLDRSAQDSTEAIRLDPRPGYFTDRGLARLQKGLDDWERNRDPEASFTGALEDFTEARRLDPENPSCWSNHANALHDMGKLKQRRSEDPVPTWNLAREEIDHALGLDGRNPGALAARSNLYLDFAHFAEVSGGNAIDAYQRLSDDAGQTLALIPDFVEVLFNRGLANVKLGYLKSGTPMERYRAAIRDFGDVIQKQPNFWSAFSRRGLAHFNVALLESGEARQESLHHALSDYSTALRGESLDVISLWGRSNVLRDLGRIPEAIEDIRAAMRLRPDDAGLKRELEALEKR